MSGARSVPILERLVLLDERGTVAVDDIEKISAATLRAIDDEIESLVVDRHIQHVIDEP